LRDTRCKKKAGSRIKSGKTDVGYITACADDLEGLTMSAAKLPERMLTAAALRKLARAHTEAALQVLAEVATKGSSEASRISAAMALLERGYGKSGTALTSDGGSRAPTLYQRIELIDGNEEKSRQDKQGSERQAPDC
jgi:hypothetical protein